MNESRPADADLGKHSKKAQVGRVFNAHSATYLQQLCFQLYKYNSGCDMLKITSNLSDVQEEGS